MSRAQCSALRTNFLPLTHTSSSSARNFENYQTIIWRLLSGAFSRRHWRTSSASPLPDASSQRTQGRALGRHCQASGHDGEGRGSVTAAESRHLPMQNKMTQLSIYLTRTLCNPHPPGEGCHHGRVGGSPTQPQIVSQGNSQNTTGRIRLCGRSRLCIRSQQDSAGRRLTEHHRVADAHKRGLPNWGGRSIRTREAIGGTHHFAKLHEITKPIRPYHKTLKHMGQT